MNLIKFEILNNIFFMDENNYIDYGRKLEMLEIL